MALSERKKDVVLDIKDDIPNLVVKNHDWPKALPDAINQIVITYFDPSIDEVKELDKHFKKLKNETMVPFCNAIESKIVPLLKKPILSGLYQSKPQKSKWNVVENNAIKLLDNLIEQINHLPADEQLEFLCTLYEGDWEREEKVHFKQVKEKLKKLHESFVEFKEMDAFQIHIAETIYEKLNSYISYVITHSYQDTQAGLARNNYNIQEIKMVKSVEQLIEQGQAQVNLNRGKSVRIFFCHLLIMSVGGFLFGIWLGSRSETMLYLAAAIIGTGILSFIVSCKYDSSLRHHQNQTRIIEAAAQHGLFRSVGESKSDNNNLTESLLTPDQQAEYKEDEESNLRPDSP